MILSTNSLQKLPDKAKEIIKKNLYITLATIGKDGLPWSSPVYAAYDEEYNFYWASGKNAKHSKNLDFKSTISFVIFDSSVPWGEGQGVYIQAKVIELTDEKDIHHAFLYRYGRIGKAEDKVEEFLGKAPRRIYKASPEKIWIRVDAKENGYFVDKRVELNISDLKTSA